ncbi:MAG: tRNA pseudouridine(55) synthase TruB [Bacillota bacterium]
MEGILNILKPPGMTSHDVVGWVRKLTGIKRVGHTGTLDPAASGVLVVMLGRATRAAQFLVDQDKEYRAEAVFGAETDTQDAAGKVVALGNASGLTPEDVLRILPYFRGKIEQVPPLVSAVHHRGKRLYELARAGKAVEVSPRSVEVYTLELLKGDWGGNRPRALFHVSCSKGTYVRAIITAMGRALGCKAYLGFLLRTRVGMFTIGAAQTLEELAALNAAVGLCGVIIPVNKALGQLPAIALKPSAVKAVKSGSRLYPAGIENCAELYAAGTMVRLVNEEELVAVARVECLEDGRTAYKPVWVCSIPAE